MKAASLPSWVNGRPQAEIGLQNRGLAYGDGFFETIAVSDGNALLLPLHLERVRQSAQKLKLTVDQIALEKEIAIAIGEAQKYIALADSFILKVILCSAFKGRGYQRPQSFTGTHRILQIFPLSSLDRCSTQTVKIGLSDYHLPHNDKLAGIKHLNRLDQILAGFTLNKDIDELLMCSVAGDVVEGSKTNLFIVKNDCVYTPKIDRCGVSGVMRQFLLNEIIPAAGLPYIEKRLFIRDLIKADELFLTNSIIGIWPVRSFAVHHYQKGVITRRLQLLLAQHELKT
ncbi:MAG: aminodeoxychorismate lyase [Pseudomonadales bacterium]|nr:aminodeoxychorismate lyase [Pseudomonadales bacterium]